MEEKQAELRRLTSEIELIQSQINTHNQNLELLTLSLNETRQTLETLEEIKGVAPGTELLIPVGSGSFVRSSITENDRVIIGIGAGFSMEKNIDEAKAIVDKRADQLDSAIKQTTERVQELSKRLEELTPKWQRLYQELSQAGGQP